MKRALKRNRNLNIDDSKELLFEEADDLRNQYGNNYWKAALAEGMGNCDEFLESVLEKNATLIISNSL
jgi:hypothetical protein